MDAKGWRSASAVGDGPQLRRLTGTLPTLTRDTAKERIEAAKQDLGALSKAMTQYLTIKDDENTTRELLRQVNEQLDQVSQNMNSNPPEVRWLCHPSQG